MSGQPACDVTWLGRLDYEEAWCQQRRQVEARVEGRISDTLLLVEHPPVYTCGRRGADGQFLADPGQLQALGARVCEVDRGGGLTFHGPGQIVAYPILDLQAWRPDLHAYLRALEEVILRTLADYGVAGQRCPGLTGVWVRRDKVAAIGVKVSRWVSCHGFALNVNVDLDWFRHIVPCGVSDRGVTSMQGLLGRELGLERVSEAIVRHFGDVFGRRMRMKVATGCES
ncbi:MAG: lipoyl(octanoyl) transferase LipB [Dehalococcoidia bacterium]